MTRMRQERARNRAHSGPLGPSTGSGQAPPRHPALCRPRRLLSGCSWSFSPSLTPYHEAFCMICIASTRPHSPVPTQHGMAPRPGDPCRKLATSAAMLSLRALRKGTHDLPAVSHRPCTAIHQALRCTVLTVYIACARLDLRRRWGLATVRPQDVLQANLARATLGRCLLIR